MEPPTGLQRTAVSGVLWVGVSQLLRIPVQVGITAILARILLPEDFGLFSMILVIVDLLSVVVGLGIGSAIVSRDELTEDQLATLFWLQLGLGLGLAALTVLLAPAAVLVYEEPRLGPLTRWLAVAFVLGPPGTVPMGLLERRLAFGRVALIETGAVLAAGAFSVGMALRGWGAASLVFLWLGTVGCQSAFALIAVGWTPRLRFRTRDLGSVVGFGLNLTGNRILYYVGRHLDSVLVGRYLGATTLGYYGLGYRMTLHPVLSMLGGVVGRVVFPVLSSMHLHKGRIQDAYLRILRCATAVSFPALAMLFVSASDVVAIFFGEQWASMIPLVRIFCVAGVVRTAAATLEPLFLAMRRADLLLRLSAVALPVIAVSLSVGLRWGAPGVAVGSLVSSLILGTVMFGFASRMLALTMGELASALGWPLACLVAAGAGAAASHYVIGPGEGHTLYRLVLDWLGGGAAALALLWVGRAPVLMDLTAVWSGRVETGRAG